LDVTENIKRGAGRSVTQRRGAKRAASISTSTGVQLEMNGKFFLKKDYPYGAQMPNHMSRIGHMSHAWLTSRRSIHVPH
jgi:hypothetical protein